MNMITYHDIIHWGLSVMLAVILTIGAVLVGIIIYIAGTRFIDKQSRAWRKRMKLPM